MRVFNKKAKQCDSILRRPRARFSPKYEAIASLLEVASNSERNSFIESRNISLQAVKRAIDCILNEPVDHSPACNHEFEAVYESDANRTACKTRCSKCGYEPISVHVHAHGERYCDD
ncbi:MAG: hypothetical protein H6Q17_546 [Bacteroidetes bacterium]|nr:hypothetical protein [Bacteroidota bacterium]